MMSPAPDARADDAPMISSSGPSQCFRVYPMKKVGKKLTDDIVPLLSSMVPAGEFNHIKGFADGTHFNP
jgi:hypothetical protein